MDDDGHHRADGAHEVGLGLDHVLIHRNRTPARAVRLAAEVHDHNARLCCSASAKSQWQQLLRVVGSVPKSLKHKPFSYFAVYLFALRICERTHTYQMFMWSTTLRLPCRRT